MRRRGPISHVAAEARPARRRGPINHGSAGRVRRGRNESRPAAPKQEVRITCVHRGEPIDSFNPGGCGCTGALGVYSCDALGRCTTGLGKCTGRIRDAVIASGLAICTECRSRAPVPIVDLSECKRNLVYHIAPASGNGTWQRNVEQILKRINLFNGRRIVSIVRGRPIAEAGNRRGRLITPLDPPEAVIEAFKGEAECLIFDNDPNLREVVTFVPMLKKVESLDPQEVTFCAHAKGVTRPVNAGVTVHPWAEILYETCLDYWPLVRSLLERRAMAGSLKKIGPGFRGSQSSWHYSGTFYWFRNRDVFSRDWRRVDQAWWGTESWPGVMFHEEEAACIFHSGVVPKLNMYSMDYLKGVVLPELEQWRREHAQEHR